MEARRPVRMLSRLAAAGKYEKNNFCLLFQKCRRHSSFLCLQLEEVLSGGKLTGLHLFGFTPQVELLYELPVGVESQALSRKQALREL